MPILNIQGSVTTVHNAKEHSPIGFLDQATSASLAQILKRYDIGMRVYLSHNKAVNTKHHGSQWGASMPIDIVLYGHEEDFEELGLSLEECNIFLQHPRESGDLTHYKNPQYLVRTGDDHPKPWCEKMSGQDSIIDAPLDYNPLESIFDLAQGPSSYSGLEQSSRISTRLKR